MSIFVNFIGRICRFFQNRRIMMKIYLYLVFQIICICVAKAETLMQIDFADSKGVGWQNGVINGQDTRWSIDCSGLVSATGTACVSESEYFAVEGCTGVFVFNVLRLPLYGAEQVTVSVRLGGERPDYLLEWEMANVNGNRMSFDGCRSDEVWLPRVTAEVSNDSLRIEIRAEELTPSRRFCFDDIVVNAKGDRARIVCRSGTDTLLFGACYDRTAAGLGIPFMVYNHDRSGEPLAIKQIDFQGDSVSLSNIAVAALYRDENSLASMGVKSADGIRFYDKNNLLYISHGDSALIHLELWGHRNLVEEGRQVQLYFTAGSVMYAAESCPLWRVEDCRLPVIVNDVKAQQVVPVAYDYGWQPQTVLTGAACDENYNIDRDSLVLWSGVIRNGEGVVVQEFKQEIPGSGALTLELPEKDNYYVVWSAHDSLLLSGADKIEVYEEAFAEMPVGWMGSEDWEIQDGYLRHRAIDASGTGRFMYPIDGSVLNGNTLVWSFGMQHEEWASSSVNYVRYYLLADVAEMRHSVYFTTDVASGERVLVAESSGKKQIVWQGGRVGQENETWQVEVAYRSTGIWEVKMGQVSHPLLLVGKAAYHLTSEFWQREMLSGLLFKYTGVSRSGKFRANPLSFHYLNERHPTQKAQVGDIVFNEIMYKPKEGKGLPNEEYLELYNLREYPVELDSLVFKDRGNIRAYLNGIIPGHGFLILCKSSGAEELSEYGKTAVVSRFALVDTGAYLVLSSMRNEVFDSVWYKPEWITDRGKREGGYSLEKRSPELTSWESGNWQASFAEEGGTPGSVNSVGTETPPPVSVNRGDILISELMYDSNPVEAEYVELYNKSNHDICLSDLSIAKRSTDGSLQSVKRLSDSCQVVPAGHYVWATSLPDDVYNNYFYCNPDNCCVLSTRLSYSNEGGTVVVINRNQEVIDEFTYSPRIHTVSQSNKRGISLERVDFDKDTQESGVWKSAGGDGSDGYGSPGMPNRAEKGQQSSVAGLSVQIHPAHTFTPDGDGVEDVLQVVMSREAPECRVVISIYNSAGQCVKTIADHLPAYGSDEFTWDGRNNGGTLCPVGMYGVSVKIIYADKTEQTLTRMRVLSR